MNLGMCDIFISLFIILISTVRLNLLDFVSVICEACHGTEVSHVVELWGRWWTPFVISHPIIQSRGALCPCLQSLLEYSDSPLLLSSHAWDMGFSRDTWGSSLDSCSLLGIACSFLSSREGEDLSRHGKALTRPPDLLLQAICVFSQLLFPFFFLNVIW